MAGFHFSPRPNRANEIHWHEWQAAAFDAARQQDKPILLGISAVWCHWCHVMDETTYSDPDVIRMINDNFIPVRVDNDERPDVNRRYNLGGWPTTAFLTPTGELLTGGTYIPPAQMRGYLQQVRAAYANSKDQILQRIAEIHAKREESQKAGSDRNGSLSSQIVDDVLKEIVNNFDPVNGGFGDEPKFPQADALELVLERFYETGDESLRNVLMTTLDHMASGGLYDQVWGGFFRYSTNREWSIPHYEKMLEDNAKLLSVYVHAWQVTGSELYLKTIRSLTVYLDTSLTNREQGGFYGSQDADETFYALPFSEREKVPAPYVDRTFYTDWNALMISAYLAAAHVLPPDQAGRSLEGESLSAFALKSLDRLWNEMYRPDVGLFHSARPGQSPQLVGLLSDASRTILAFLDAYQSTGDTIYLQRAQILADGALAADHDESAGAFWSEPPGREALGLLRVADQSMNENATMAEALMRLTRFLGDGRYRSAAEKALAHFANDYVRSSFLAADYARAISHFLTEPVSVHIVGGVDDPRTAVLEAAALKTYAPDKMVQVLDPRRDAEQLATLGYPHDGTPLVYVCVGSRCLAPVSDAKGIEEGIQQVRENAAPAGE